MTKTRDTYLPFGVPDLTEVEIEAVARVMRSGWIGMGPETLKFETELADFVGAADIVTVNSCTSALFLAMMLAGVGPGHEVIVPSLTWCSTVNAALYAGATPVFCDVDASTMSISSRSILQAVTAATRAVVVVHYGGLALDVDSLRHSLPSHVEIIEDAAHALGGRYPDGRPVGASGNLTCFSFYANKNLSTADGGALVPRDQQEGEHARRLRMNGMETHAWSRYINPSTVALAGIRELGFKMNYTDLQAAIGRVQLARAREMSSRRLSLAKQYHLALSKAIPSLRFQTGVLEPGHARHLLVVGLDAARKSLSRDALLSSLRRRNIGASVHYPPLHNMPLYAPFVRKPLPVTEALASSILTLPFGARMTSADVDYVCENLIELLRDENAEDFSQ